MRIIAPEIDLSRITLPMCGAFIAGTLAAISLAVYCYRTGDPILSLLALVGAIFGWLFGVLVAPLSPDEEKKFNELAKVASGFVTGYVLSKLDPVIGALVTPDQSTHLALISSRAIAEQVLVTLSSFGMALLFVHAARAYWSGRDAATEAAIKEWMGQQNDAKLSHAEAVRRLLTKGLAAE